MEKASSEKSTGALIILAIIAVFFILVLVSSIIDNCLSGGYGKKSDVSRIENEAPNEIDRLLDSSDVRERDSTRAATMRLQQLSRQATSDDLSPVVRTPYRDEMISSDATKRSSNIGESEEFVFKPTPAKIEGQKYTESPLRNLIN
jgi:hypothetical protein